MSFNDNQYFYAALWWMASFPGGQRYVSDICALHGRPLPDLRVNAAKQAAPAAREQCLALFDAVYDTLRQGRAAVKTAGASGVRYIEVSPDMIGSDKKNFSVAGSMFLHDDGQILVPLMMGRKLKTISQEYPGQPPVNHRLVNLSAENFTGRSEVVRQGFQAAVAGPFPCIEVTKPMQIGAGDTYSLTAPGDRILWEGQQSRIVRKEQLDKGEINLVPSITAVERKPAGPL